MAAQAQLALSPRAERREFWTAGQRQAHSLHEVSYRACFKPQLPRYFIERYTQPGDTVYDPFGGRGTTALEAALLNRRVISNDVNPLSRVLLEPRLAPPALAEVQERLAQIAYRPGAESGIDLSMFYHPETLAEIVSLREYLMQRRAASGEDSIDRWIRMVATNRLTGHSPGFFSVYSFPPNQAVSAISQKRINGKRKQIPEYRDTRKLILRKSRALLKDLNEAGCSALAASAPRFYECDARATPGIRTASVALTVTSPPFLDIVQYADDNWLRAWFNDISTDAVAPRITMARRVEDWSEVMGTVLRELFRITRPDGRVAFEVGELRKGQVRLEEQVLPLGIAAGFVCEGVLINEQSFTKTSHIWGVANNRAGTNSNRIVLLRKP
jgi:hypothetical protein